MEMSRVLHFAGAVLLCTGPAFCADQKPPKPAHQPPAAAARPNAGGQPKANGGPKRAPNSDPQRFVNPANPVTMLFNASPEQRDRALEKATPEQQEQARKLLAWYDNLSPGEKQIQLERVQRFQQMSPAERGEIRRQMQALNQLQQPRKGLVAQALRRLQRMPDDQRQEVLNSEQFKSTFSADEQKIITTLGQIWFPPE
jgi:hypothetical protein